MALNLLIDRRLADIAVGVRAHSGPADDPVCGGGRYIFAVPWRDRTIIGTWYAPLTTGADPAPVVARGLEAFLAEFNAACPGLDLTAREVLRCQWGMVPLKAGMEPGRADALADRPRFVAPAERRGLVAVEGVKYTTARAVAKQAVDRLVRQRALRAGRCRTDTLRLDTLAPAAPTRDDEVVRAVRDEMATTLLDVALRRTDLAAAGPPDRAALSAAAALMARELGWTDAVAEHETETTARALRPPAGLEQVAR